MNDPNGLVVLDGRYHLYYQHNPLGIEWGNMSWGHAVSDDGIRWEQLPLAIGRNDAGGYTIFSGSVVLDREDTAGRARDGRPPVVACFTADHRCPEHRQTIHVAFSHDGGTSFTEYKGNPVLDVEEAKFGDPKVFRHDPTGRWIMVNIRAYGQGRVEFYGSGDLLHWEKLGQFEAPDEAPGTWECPDLFPLWIEGDPARIKWALKVNHQVKGRGAAGSYFLGDFDGQVFRRDGTPAQRIAPHADPYYAEVTYNDDPAARFGQATQIGWLRLTPGDRPWTGAQSIPRTTALVDTAAGPRLVQRPIATLDALRAPLGEMGGCGADGARLAACDPPMAALDVELELADLDAAAGLALDLDAGELRVRVDPQAGSVTIDLDEQRLEAGAIPPIQDGLARLRVIYDATLVEAFYGGGECVVAADVERATCCRSVRTVADSSSARLVRSAAFTLFP
jgi:sucrose-6-phosphate hydrolase SacC (GH32 family)